ncbi:MAG: nucleotidyltransferase domain-containing protein [Candidatus Poribacteria bacterium]|nr:nucleotidyltransferase domain-containing protein [Candidatus Poribacteria bacterium]
MREFEPLQVILFGSYAYGTPTEDSDVDLLVVLGTLLDLITPTLPDWHTWRSDVSNLSKYAVDPRYPGDSATANDAEQAMAICPQVRQEVRENLKSSNKMKELD